tara:strand:- start:31 stop:432 length:402 start_codon:yes stop_codon:yes gene_type:complete
MAVNGNTIIIWIDETVIGSQKGVTFDSSADTLDVSDKTSAAAKFIPGKTTDTVTCSAFYVRDNGAYTALRTAYDSGLEVEVDWFHTSSDGLTGSGEQTAQALVNSLSISAPEHGPAELELSLQITGGWQTYSV